VLRTGDGAWVLPVGALSDYPTTPPVLGLRRVDRRDAVAT
jgi:hypothetical protein